MVRKGVSGDVMEAGAWRGGACIFMKVCVLAVNFAFFAPPADENNDDDV